MNQFHLYGFKVVHYYSLPAEEIDIWNIKNPMCEAFPRVASCTFHRYGTGGRQEGRKMSRGRQESRKVSQI